MSNLDLLSMALKNLWRRRLRTFLTILGVVIGAASIIVMLSLGYGMKYNNQKLIEEMGSIDVIRVNSYPIYDFETDKETEARPLTDRTVIDLEKIEHVSAVLPMLAVEGPILISGKYQSYGEIMGVDPEKFALFDIKLNWGNTLKEGDNAVALVGAQVASNFYNPNSRGRRNFNEKNVDLQKDKVEIAIGQKYDFETKKTTFQKKYKLNVAGETTPDDYENAFNVYIPLEFAEKIQRDQKKINDIEKSEGFGGDFGRRESNNSKYSTILVKVDDIKNVRDVYENLKNNNYNANSNIEITDSLNKGVERSQKTLGGIGAISLLVAAIGIANTMVMSIYERIKEIGIMKVIGASVSDIKKMFLTEAAIIGLFGGLLGVGLSYIASYLLNYFASKGAQDPGSQIGGVIGMGGPGMGEEGSVISIIPIWLVGVALIFSVIIGIISGYYPAKKATKLSALDAIRTQ